ncbi:toprim domain-containing protein [Candidatus Woesearchaeota archaeon]|nr:toprim domain-containing protein [Candidatus Woesearchaeota archaeon]
MTEIQELLDEIDRLRTSCNLIIVEGKKDRAALSRLEITNIRELNKPIFQEIEDIAQSEKEVVILTDLDKEGKKLYAKLKSGLSERGVKIDDRFRDFLFKNTSLTQIEGLTSYLYSIGVKKELDNDLH